MSNFDFDQAAASMFGGAHPTTPAPMRSSSPQTSDDVLAERMFGASSKPSGPAAPAQRDRRAFDDLTEGEQGSRMYGDTDPTLTHSGAVQAIINSALEDHLHDPETAGEIAGQYAEVFAQHQLNATESKEIADIGASILRTPPTPELVASWQETAVTNLKAEYGVQNVRQVLNDARRYIDSVPDAKDMLDAWGLGSHPRIVAIAAARGRAMRAAGKL